MSELTTLIYLKKNDMYLMMHRISKKNDINKDKWLGIGGHFEKNESPTECIVREVKEETGYEITNPDYRGIVTFVAFDSKSDYENNQGGICEYVHVFTTEKFTGDESKCGVNFPCDEGKLEWVKIKDVYNLPIWEGDKLFLKALEDNKGFFNLKLVYVANELVDYKRF